MSRDFIQTVFGPFVELPPEVARFINRVSRRDPEFIPRKKYFKKKPDNDLATMSPDDFCNLLGKKKIKVEHPEQTEDDMPVDKALEIYEKYKKEKNKKN